MSGTGRAAVAIALPLGLALVVEPALELAPELRETSTSVEIQADLHTVWEAVIAFPPIETEPGFPFTFGIAYPLSAEIEGEGVGAVRHCRFDTGAFVEPITVWEVDRRLEFDVESSPSTMTETSFYENLELPHLTGTFVSERGRFLLEPMANGGVQLTGTTWYRQALWPQAYWSPIAEALIHAIHLRVLHHVRDVAEAAMAERRSTGD